MGSTSSKQSGGVSMEHIAKNYQTAIKKNKKETKNIYNFGYLETKTKKQRQNALKKAIKNLGSNPVRFFLQTQNPIHEEDLEYVYTQFPVNYSGNK